MGWEWSRLNNICELIEDCPHSTAPDEGEGYPLIRTPNVGYGKLELKDVHRVCKAVYLKRNVRATPVTHDLIFAREAPAGNIAVIEDGEQVCLGQRTVLVRPFKEHLNPYYLAYYILSPISQQILVNSSTGTTVAHVNLSDFRPYLIAIPPYKEQLKIVEMINSVIPVVNQYGNMRYRIDILNDTINIRLKKSILQEAIQGKLIPQDPNDEPASILLQRIKEEKHKLVKEDYLKKKDLVDSVIFKGDDNKYFEKKGKETVCIDEEIPFEIPRTWEWVRLDDICEYIQRGKSPKYSLIKKYPVVAQKCNQWSGFSIDKAQFIVPETISSYGEERKLQDRDLLWNSTGLGTLGRMAIYYSILNPYELAVADSHVTVIRAFKQYVCPEYLYAYFTSYTVQSVIEDKSDGSTKQKELAANTVKAYLVPLPPYEEQKRIINRINEVFAHLT